MYSLPSINVGAMARNFMKFGEGEGIKIHEIFFSFGTLWLI